MQNDRPAEQSSSTSSVVEGKTARFWDIKYIFTNFVLIVIAAIAAVYQYIVYANVITQDPFYETNLHLSLSFLTYQYTATRNGQLLVSPPALDFFQIFLIVAIVYNGLHIYYFKKKKRR